MNHRTKLKRGLDRIEIELVPFVIPRPPQEGEDRGEGGATKPKSDGFPLNPKSKTCGEQGRTIQNLKW